MSLERDQNLVWQCRRGDQTAFADLVNIYKKPVYNLAYRMVQDLTEAEDLSQETFLRVYRHLERYDTRQKFSTWIFTIATRLCLDHLRKNKKELDQLSYDLSDQSPLPEEQVIRKQSRQEVDDAVSCLPEKYRMVIILKHFNELSYEEVASVLEIPVNTVKTHLFRAREMLRKLLTTEKAGARNG